MYQNQSHWIVNSLVKFINFRGEFRVYKQNLSSKYTWHRIPSGWGSLPSSFMRCFQSWATLSCNCLLWFGHVQCSSSWKSKSNHIIVDDIAYDFCGSEDKLGKSWMHKTLSHDDDDDDDDDDDGKCFSHFDFVSYYSLMH